MAKKDAGKLAARSQPHATPSRAELLGQIALVPSSEAADTIRAFTGSKFGEKPDLRTLISELRTQIDASQKGDTSRSEAMLVTQMHTLNSIFSYLALHAHAADQLNQLDTYMRLALKCQNQCRATIETLARLRNPPSVAFVTQANIANGPQQVNNGVPLLRAENPKTEPSKLLEATHGQQLEPIAPSAAGRIDTHLEAVEPIDRPAYAPG